MERRSATSDNLNISSNTSTPASASSTPVLAYTFAFLLVAGAGYGGAAYYALHDPAFRKLWLENAPAAQTAMDVVQRLQETSIDEVKEKVDTSASEVKKTVDTVKATAIQKYEKTTETIANVKETTLHGYDAARKKAHEVQEAAEAKLNNIAAFLGSVKDEAVTTYETAHKKVEETQDRVKTFAHNVEQTYHSAINSAEETYENIRSKVSGEPPKRKPAKPELSEQLLGSAPVRTVHKETPKPAATAPAPGPKEDTKAVEEKERKVVQAASVESATVNEPVMPELAPEDTSRATATDKIPPPQAQLSKPVEKKGKHDGVPTASTLKPVVDSGVVVADNKEAPHTTESATLITADGPIVTTPTANVSKEVLLTSLRDVEKQLSLVTGDKAAAHFAHSLAALSSTLADLIGVNHTAASSRKFEQAREQLLAMKEYLGSLEQEETKLMENALKDQANKFAQALREHHEVSQKALEEQATKLEGGFNTKLEEELERQRADFNQELADRLSEQAKEFRRALGAELERQAKELEKHWTKEVKTRVDEERGGRLARLDHLALKLKYLERISLDAGEQLDRSHKIHLLWSALKSVDDVLELPHQTSLVKEMKVLASVGKDFPLVETVISTIPAEAIREGVPTALDLECQFDSLREAVNNAQYMPPYGGPVSYGVSYLLSLVTFTKHGLVAGDDVQSILARGEHYLREGDVENAAREINQLKGWPKRLANDWLTQARRHVEVKQALEVMETHLSLLSLGAV
ncbi:Formation of crista junctions protein 1 [Gaertneriomyces sp. JEL0708]|nr:Formation of crista junctions protein 1 [Gaertneriomyces sp. JEL0708]